MIDKIKLIRYIFRITIPYIIYKYLKSVKLKKCVKEMAGKVNCYEVFILYIFFLTIYCYINKGGRDNWCKLWIR